MVVVVMEEVAASVTASTVSTRAATQQKLSGGRGRHRHSSSPPGLKAAAWARRPRAHLRFRAAGSRLVPAARVPRAADACN